MNQIRSRRSVTLERADILNSNTLGENRTISRVAGAPPTLPTPTLNYVVRRYGGLSVVVPNIALGLIGNPDEGSSSPSPLRFPRQQQRRHYPHSQSTPNEQQCLDQEERRSSDSNEYLSVGGNAERRPRLIKDPYGKFAPLFGGRIVLGPGKGPFIISILFLISLLTNLILQKSVIDTYCGGLPVYVTGVVLGVATFYSFLTMSITDPGVVPKNYSLEELLAETEEYRARYPDERYFRYCTKCKTCRPPRTFHCSRCEICIRQQDTHLWAAGTCIGERNRRMYFVYILLQNLLGAYLLVTTLIMGPHVVKTQKGYTRDLIQMISSTVSSMTLLFFPQSGILMLIYKFYLIGVGRTAREEYRKYHCYDTEDCVVEKHTVCINIRNFFCTNSYPSVFRRRHNRVDPESIQTDMPDPWVLDDTIIRRRQHLQLTDSRELIQMQNFIPPEVDEEDIINANADATAINENARLSEVASYARGKSTPSVPLFDQGLNPMMTRIKMPRKSKPSLVLQQQIDAIHKEAKVPKATQSYHKRQKLPLCLSDGCIPRTKDGLPEMIQLSRATQLRRIIQMILLRDREGLIEMSSRVNIAALVGMNRFDPDNLQLLELNNGLPMIAPRRQDPAANHRLGAGVLGIPQMVAAGLLPTARDLANSVETMIGRGRVRRLPPVGRQRYTPITVIGGAATVGTPAAPRRVLNIEADPLPPQTHASLPNQPSQTLPMTIRPHHSHHHHHHSHLRSATNAATTATSSSNAASSSNCNRTPSTGLPLPVQQTVVTNGLDDERSNNITHY